MCWLLSLWRPNVNSQAVQTFDRDLNGVAWNHRPDARRSTCVNEIAWLEPIQLRQERNHIRHGPDQVREIRALFYFTIQRQRDPSSFRMPDLGNWMDCAE